MSIIIDTGVFYALLDRGDINHLDALAIMVHTLDGRFGKAFTTDYIVLETTLLLKARIGVDAVKAILGFLEESGITVIVIDEVTFRKSLKILLKNPEILSLCDAATLSLIEELNIETLATFDLRSFSSYTVNIVGKGYFSTLNKEEKERIRNLLQFKRGTGCR